ncbi:FtsX-like permease family protein [Paenibacillus alvei]|uniref:FtsX-like permease family protein n=1 Tax=Paenibacillus alvei TaxID=44250 RepID=A0ABT4H0P4_PAEAL|nr:FtsX-like permease family protein [Paenibacillus alvei]MCY7483994.1 FtsX-like permease family protein [Paenibacillus alvei]MCY9544247.1 FtsX-like permease family protein [Paenibacillus alvei]MCY9702855.1 FtsX-like permease family protein [Paenibacillus alvei]MCY9733169.1 FtsX-like permease family protein [Paenibacillus alvei]MCY9754035.1 FtsX-like permease family protein [Paenibacillus alvei]
MNIVNTLTIRHLMQNKRRTLVTIIGVIISVAMVTAVATLGFSFLDLMKRQTIADGGEWHVLYQNVSKEQLEAIQNDDATKVVTITQDLGYAPLVGKQNSSKPYLFIQAYNAQGFTHFPIQLSKGRLPQTDKEVVISEAIVKNEKVNYKIGDHLTLSVGERFEKGNEKPLDQSEMLRYENGKLTESLQLITNKEYTVVGCIKRPVMEPAWAPGHTIISYIDETSIKATDRVNAAVVLKTVDRSLFEHAEQLANSNNIENVLYNHELLHYYGLSKNKASSSMLISLSVIIMAVIIIGSISLIYNAFAISVSERSRHLGMLASVGATKRQKRNSVFFEGVIIGAISIPIGILCGLAGIGITFLFINPIMQGALVTTEKLTLIITPMSLLIACVVSMLTIFISTFVPAIKASKISAIDAIRQTADVKLTRRAVKTSKLMRKLFGIEAEIGLKNIKRNKRRYHATVFSIIISIVLFLTVSFYTANLKQSLALSLEGVNYDIHIWYNNGNQMDDTTVQSIVSLDGVTEYNVTEMYRVNAWIGEAAIANELQEAVKKDRSVLKEGKYLYDININAMNDSSLQAYAKAVGANVEQLMNPDHPAAIVVDTIQYKDEATNKFVQTKNIHAKIGQSLQLSYISEETNKETDLKEVTIAAKTDQLPMGIRSSAVGELDIVVSKRVLERLIDEKIGAYGQSQLFLKSKDPLKTQQEIEEFRDSNLSFLNEYQSRAVEEQRILIMSVFSYGFIILISAISIANIFNTISTSISLRKREFAMLKSVGMTPKGFAKMMNYESIFYGVKSLLFGLPLSFVVMYLIHSALSQRFHFELSFSWVSILSVIAAVFIIVGSAMLYSSAKVKKENIIDALKQENI